MGALTLTSPLNEDSAHNAYLESLRLWLTLGGVGARSRRGAGAIGIAKRVEAERLGVPCSLQELTEYLTQVCKRRKVSAALQEIFCLARTRRVLIGRPFQTGEEAQKKLLSMLREARQDRPHSHKAWGRSVGLRPTRSASRQNPQSLDPSPGSSECWTVPKSGARSSHRRSFPDSAFGTRRSPHSGAIPRGTEWKKLDRFASPILLRPVRIWEGSP